jgi:hypothetical protein
MPNGREPYSASTEAPMRAVEAIAFTLAVLATPAHAQAPRQQPQQQKPLIFNGNVFDPPPQAQAPAPPARTAAQPRAAHHVKKHRGAS